MNQSSSEINLVLLSNAFWLLATIAVVLAAVGCIGFVALTLAEWKQGVQKQPRTRQRILAASRADPLAHTDATAMELTLLGAFIRHRGRTLSRTKPRYLVSVRGTGIASTAGDPQERGTIS